MSDTKQPAPAIMSAQELVESIRETEAYPPGGLVLNHEQALAAVEAYTAAIREKALEDAAVAQCVMCQSGDPLVYGLPPGAKEGETWHHLNEAPAYNEDTWDICRGRKIRALKAAR